MAQSTPYIINFGRLKPGVHQYSYAIEGPFFASYEHAIIHKCQTRVDLSLNKTRQNLLQLDFHLSGHLYLDCDRCLENLPYSIDDHYHLLVKLEEQDERLADDDEDEILFLDPGAYEIDLAPHIYDFHHLSVPIKKECQHINARCAEIDQMLSSGNMQDGQDEAPEDDPRWEALRKLKNKQNT